MVSAPLKKNVLVSWDDEIPSIWEKNMFHTPENNAQTWCWTNMNKNDLFKMTLIWGVPHLSTFGYNTSTMSRATACCQFNRCLIWRPNHYLRSSSRWWHHPIPPIANQKKTKWKKKHEKQQNWLVVGPPLWKIWKSIGMMTFPIYGKIKHGNQTTNQKKMGVPDFEPCDPTCSCKKLLEPQEKTPPNSSESSPVLSVANNNRGGQWVHPNKKWTTLQLTYSYEKYGQKMKWT